MSSPATQKHQDTPVKFRLISVAFELKRANTQSRPAGAAPDLCDVATAAGFSARPAVTHPATQTNVCGDKVSQLPSGGWSYFDTRPVARPCPPQMDSDLARLPLA